MATRWFSRTMVWLSCGLVLTVACGSENGGKDDESPVTGVNATTGLSTSTSTSGGNGTFGNNSTTGSGGMLTRSNDNCDGVEARDGEPCDMQGLVCLDAAGRLCACGVIGPEDEWSCRGVVSSAGAPGDGGAAGAAGAAGASEGGAAGQKD